jgi:hypothetical protein
MSNLHDLKKEIAELEAQAAKVQDQAMPVTPAPVPEPAPVRTGVFDDLLAAENRDRQERQKADAMNAKFKSCGDCYFVQPITQNACELCGAVPLWLAATECPENRERDGLRTMAAEYTIEQLGAAMRSGWCSNRPERERVAKNILAARIRQRDIQEVRNRVAAAVNTFDQEDKRREILPPKERVRELATVYERQAAEIRQQLAELQKTMGSSEREK